ncbi:MAG TPA: glycoside hydrolase family 38 C-terminal domain-containing protein [Clostridia bacterium]|nr:glycoside hydrolase family 38 C-terminal domain-containing protein [Clostridia bacterium]
MKTKSVHLVCNAHLDPVWQWEWEEGVAAAISTFRTAADLCEEFDYIFCHNEVILYEWVREYEPQLFKRIQKLVRQGKWHIMGGWYLQPDCNIPSGESIVRQILLGRIYFEKYFDSKPKTAINLDSFGHSRGLVQIMRKSGFDSYLVCRPNDSTKPFFNRDFIWVGFAGTEIAARHRVPGYNTKLGSARVQIENIINEIDIDKDVNIILWGVGNHGGGPSRQDLRDLAELIEKADISIKHSTPDDYFAERLKSNEPIPRIDTQIGPFQVGSYTTMARVKQKHRALENELYMTEKMVSAAVLNGLMEYPAEEFKQVMEDLAFAEFHDILPGTSVQPAEDMAIRLMDHGLEILSRLKMRAFFKLVGDEPKAAKDEYPILVYNPHPYPVNAAVECEFMLADQNWKKEFSMPKVYQGDVELPSQPEKELSTIPLDWRKRVVFQAELKPSSMNRFSCYTHILPQKPASSIEPEDGYYKFDNGSMKCWINVKTGLIDKYEVDGMDYLKTGAFKPLVIMDDHDPWGMRVTSFKEVCGEFKLMNREESAALTSVLKHELAPIRVIEQGDVRVVIEAFLKYKSSRIAVQYKLSRFSNEVEIFYRVFWNEMERMLKLSVPTLLNDSYHVGQTCFGTERLYTNGDEAVSQKWCATVSDVDDKAVTVINSGTHGSSFKNGEMFLSVMRSPAYTAHPLPERVTCPQDRLLAHIDIGERLFTYYLNAGTKTERMEHVGREAAVHAEKPYALSFSPHGDGKKVTPLVIISGGVVEMPAFKKAERTDEFVVRLYEPSGTKQKITLSIPMFGINKEIEFIGHEVKTFVVNKGMIKETDLMENDLQ